MAQEMVLQKLEILKSSDPEFLVKCEQCDRTFSSDRSLRCHVKIHNEKILHCCFCEEVFNRTDTLFIHAVDHIIARRQSVECYAVGCNKTFNAILDADKHFHLEHIIDGMHFAHCRECDEGVTSYRRLLSHFALKHGELKEFAETNSEKLKLYLKEKKKLSNRQSRKRKNEECSNEKIQITPQLSREDLILSEERIEDEEVDSLGEQQNPELVEVVSMLKSAVTPENEETPPEMLGKISNFLSKLFPLHNEVYYKCAHCKIGFEDAILWMTHLGFHDAEDPFKCTGCDKKFDNRQLFVIHLTYFAHGANISGVEEGQMSE